MSYEAFRAVAHAYDGEPSDNSIRFASGVTRERLLYGVGAPRLAEVPDSEFYQLAVSDKVSNLVGVWRVGELDGTSAYHVVRSDTRDGSGVNVSRFEMSEVELRGDAQVLSGSVAHEDLIIPHDGRTATIGGMAISPIIETIGMRA